MEGPGVDFIDDPLYGKNPRQVESTGRRTSTLIPQTEKKLEFVSQSPVPIVEKSIRNRDSK